MQHFVQWFEIPVLDMNRAKKFYADVFGIQTTSQTVAPGIEMEAFPWEKGGVGAPGALVKAPNYTPSHAGTVVYATVEDIEKTLGAIESAGGKTLMSKTPIGEHGFIGMFEDTEGNRLGLHSM